MNEERDATVLQVLEAELPPSTVDIDRAVQAGRRRERTRRGLAAGALAGVVVVAGIGLVAVNREPSAPPVLPASSGTGSASSAPPACVAAALTGPNGFAATTMSPNGRFIAGSVDGSGAPLLWTDGTATQLNLPAGVTAEPHGVNDDGAVVGLARHNNRTLPFVFRGGAYTELPVPSGAEGAAHGVNGRGDAVGEVFWPDGKSKAMLWRASGGMTTLTSTTKWANARAIADDGTIFGSLDDGATPYSWGPDGTGRAMPTPPGSTSGKVFGVAGDYAYGHAGTAPQPTGSAGRSGDSKGESSGEPRWVRWRLSTGAVVEVTGLSATGVDATGAVVGFVRQGTHFAPARWRDGKITLLPGPDGAEATGTEVATSHDGTRLAGGTLTWRC